MPPDVFGFVRKQAGLVRWGLQGVGQELQREVLHRDPDGTEVIRLRGPAPLRILPQFGHVSAGRMLVPDSLEPTYKWSPGNLWRTAPDRVPAGDVDVVRVPEVVSMRHLWEWNYYHFLQDVLGKLEVIDRVPELDGLPLGLSQSCHDVGWMRPVLECGALAARNWLIPEPGQVIEAESLVYVRQELGAQRRRSHAVTDAMLGDTPAGDRRLFVGRDDASTRHLTNHDEIHALATDHGFEYVGSLSTMHPREQAELFRSAGVILGIHGAGLTNIMHRAGSPTTVIELIGRQYTDPGFLRLSSALGFRFWRVLGESEPGPPQSAHFWMDPTELATILEQVDAAN